MEEIRSYFASDYKIIDKKIYDSNNKIIDNKYLEIDNISYTLLDILFYYENRHLPHFEYLKKAENLGISPIDSNLIYKISLLTPKETYKKRKYQLVYDFKFILNYIIKKRFTIIVPFSLSSKINIFNCVSCLTTGNTKMPFLTRKNLFENERILSKPFKKYTAEFILQFKENNLSNNKIVALFIDNTDWQEKEFLNSYNIHWNCPIFYLSNNSDSIKGNEIFIEVKNDRIEPIKLKMIWDEIEKYILESD